MANDVVSVEVPGFDCLPMPLAVVLALVPQVIPAMVGVVAGVVLGRRSVRRGSRRSGVAVGSWVDWIGASAVGTVVLGVLFVIAVAASWSICADLSTVVAMAALVAPMTGLAFGLLAWEIEVSDPRHPRAAGRSAGVELPAAAAQPPVAARLRPPIELPAGPPTGPVTVDPAAVEVLQRRDMRGGR